MKPSEDKKFLDEFNSQWKELWRDLVGDKFNAEKIAGNDYSMLFIERGTVVTSTRADKPLTYNETLLQHWRAKNLKTLPPDPNVGGWRKFSQTMKNAQKRPQLQKATPLKSNRRVKQPKKGGRGWLHTEMYQESLQR